MPTDYRETAYAWAGTGRNAMVDAVARYLHHTESLHLHDVGGECCGYCWLRAGRSVRALADAGHLDAPERLGHPVADAAPDPDLARADAVWHREHPADCCPNAATCGECAGVAS